MLRGMDDTRLTPARGANPPSQVRLAREAAALRDNLRKRKDQARQRAARSDAPREAPAMADRTRLPTSPDEAA